MKIFLKLCSIFCAVLIFQTAALSLNESFTVISDTYLNSDKTENKMTPSIKKLLQAVEMANESNSECVIFLGDNLHSANRYDLVMFSKIIKKINKPVYVTVGNRDLSKTKGLVKEDYYRILNKFSNNKLKTVPSYKKHGDLVFIFLSGVNEGIPGYRGYYKLNELDYLDKILTKFKDKKIIIFQHFPVIEPKIDETRKIVKPENYLKVLTAHNNVIAVISGHYHAEGIFENNGIKHISVASLGVNSEFEQIKVFKNKDGTYTLTTKIYNIE